MIFLQNLRHVVSEKGHGPGEKGALHVAKLKLARGNTRFAYKYLKKIICILILVANIHGIWSSK